MHAIISVIHREGLNVEEYFQQFLYDNPEFYEHNLVLFREDALEQLKQQADANPDTDWTKEYNSQTDDERIASFCEDYNYIVEENGDIYEDYNPNGFCDWYVIGGRWDNSFIDFNNQGHNTIRLNDFNRIESLDCPYGCVLEYDGDNIITEDMDVKDWNEQIEKAKIYGEQNSIDLYMTIVDIHQ